MGRQPSSQFPDSLDGGEVGAVGWQEQQSEVLSALAQPRCKKLGVVIPSVIQDNDHFLSSRAVPQQLFQERLEGVGVEFGGYGANELAAFQADRAKAGNGLARRGVDKYRILVFRRHPHPAARSMLLEVAFIQASQLNVLFFGQAPQFF